MSLIKLGVLFVIEKNKMNKKGLCPIRCRITYRGKRKILSTGIFLEPKHWDSSKQKVARANRNSHQANAQLSLIQQKLNQAFLLLQANMSEFEVDDIVNAFKGKTRKKQVGIVMYFTTYLEKQKKLIGVEIKQVTWNKYNYVFQHLKEFIRNRYKMQDVLLSNLDELFLVEFEYYLKTEKGNKQITVNKSIQRLKSIVRSAHQEKLLEVNPFIGHRAKKVKTSIVFLSADELGHLEEYKFIQPRLRSVRDLFVFSCYTGLAYQEVLNLRSKNLVKGYDNEIWIQMMRSKTNSPIAVPLLPKAKTIIDRYQDGEKLLPLYSNQKINSYLKEIAGVLGIEKRLTFHVARKTFATTVLLYNGVPMEIVSELLGHSKLSITQDHYAKVVRKKVGEEMSVLKQKLISN